MKKQPTRQPTIRLYKRGGTYMYSFILDGVRHRKSTGARTETEALRAAQRDLLLALRDDGSLDPATAPCHKVFEDFYKRKQSMRAGNTLANLKRFAGKFTDHFGKTKPLGMLTKLHVEDWRDWLLKQPVDIKGRTGTYSPKTVKEHIEWLSSVYNYYQLPNPCHNVERPKRTKAQQVEDLKYYTTEEINKLLALSEAIYQDEQARDSETNWTPFYFWLRMLAWTGMRVGEAQGIRFKDIDHDQQRIRVISDKTGDTRTLVLRGTGGPAACWHFVEELEQMALLHYADDETRGQWQGWDGQDQAYWRDMCQPYADKPLWYLYDDWFYKALDRLCQRAEIPFKGVHALRHTFATQALKTWNISVLAKWLGHKDISTTYSVYGHLTNEDPPDFVYD